MSSRGMSGDAVFESAAIPQVGDVSESHQPISGLGVTDEDDIATRPPTAASRLSTVTLRVHRVRNDPTSLKCDLVSTLYSSDGG